MKYTDVPQTEAEDKDGKIKEGYEKWAYSWKKVFPDTPEEIAIREKPAKAVTDLKAMIAAENSDPTKWKIEEVVARIKAIETILNLR